MSTDFQIGDRVEAGWASASHPGSSWQPPRGVIIGIDETHFRVRWDNGYEANFPRVELRLYKAAQRHFKGVHVAAEAEPVAGAREAA